MFPGRVGDAAVVGAGLPGLLEQMALAEINTPPRIAAFLATLAHESSLLYNIKQRGATAVYAGRGYIQLTGAPNYSDAGKYLGVDLATTPDLALSLAWSAKIARWYWTVARHCNAMADALQMGKVCAAIGYPLGDGTEDQRRTASFAAALKYLTGSVPDGISSTRSPQAVVWSSAEKQGKWAAPNGDLVNNNVRTDGKYPLGVQTLTVYGPDSWEVEHDHNYAPVASQGAIKSYPCTQRNFNPPRPIDSFTEADASFKFTAPDDAGGEWNRSFDIWTGKWGGITGELMVWTDHRYNGSLPPKNAVETNWPVIGGQRFIAWKRPLNVGDIRPYIAFVMDPLVAEGAVDLLAIFKWCVAKGWLKATDTIAAIEYGIELAHGAGKKRIHRLDNYTLNTK